MQMRHCGSVFLVKHDLRVRPMFHWSTRRIRAHITICFIAFALIRFLQHRIKKELKESFSAERIRRELYRIQDSILRNTVADEKYVINAALLDEDYQLIHQPIIFNL